MNKRLAIVIGIVVIAGAAVYYFTRAPQIANYPPTHGTNVIAFGDSLIYGIGATEGHDLISLVSQKTRTTIINKGVGGDTTARALERLDRDVLSNDPRVVMVLLGGNDYLQRVPKEQTFANLHSIVSRIQARGAVVLLLGVRGGLLHDTYRSDFDSFAKENHVAYVPNILEDTLEHKELMYDTVHPNDQGYELIAEKVAPVLLGILK